MKKSHLFRFVLVLALVICLGMGLTAFAQKKDKEKGKPGGDEEPTYVTLEINELFPGTIILSDGKGIYRDWRLEGGDPCVKGWVKSNGFFFIYFNRGSDLGSDCEFAYPDEIRRFCMMFPEDVRLELGLEDTAYAFDSERIRMEVLFAKRAIETEVYIMFHYLGESYSLDIVGDIIGSGDTRTVFNTYRTAQLWRSIPGPRKPWREPIGAPFVFPFEITVTK